MTSLMIGNNELTNFVKGMKFYKSKKKTIQEAADGTRVVDFGNTQYDIQVTFIPMNSSQYTFVLGTIASDTLTIKVYNPYTRSLQTYTAIYDDFDLEFYTLRDSVKMLNSFTVTFHAL